MIFLCKKCNLEKEKYPKRNICVDCFKLNNQDYYLKNKDHIKNKVKNYKNNNLEKIQEYDRQRKKTNESKEKNKLYRLNNPNIKENKKKYYQKNKERELKRSKEYKKNNRDIYNKINKNRYRNDPSFRLRDIFSKIIRNKLKKQNSSKNNESFIKYLQYSIDELKSHIESLFEPWMNWNNQGNYDSKLWDDNDSTTWFWQLDHIIPQSDLIYDSMEHDNFKKCWSLENLRPYSAKQNILDGSNRIRHSNELKD